MNTLTPGLATPASHTNPHPASAHLATTPPTRPLWQRLLPLFILMPSIGLVLSGVLTWLNLGWRDDFVLRWMHSFAAALPVMPLGLGLMVLMERWAGPRLQKGPAWLRRVLLAALTAAAMELVMATVVTLSNRGWGPGLAHAWLKAFAGSLPAGMAIGLLMAFVIKPRMERWLRA